MRKSLMQTFSLKFWLYLLGIRVELIAFGFQFVPFFTIILCTFILALFFCASINKAFFLTILYFTCLMFLILK